MTSDDLSLRLILIDRHCLRLVSALLAECDEEWMTGKVYINLNS
jgi:hypothetical protein